MSRWGQSLNKIVDIHRSKDSIQEQYEEQMVESWQRSYDLIESQNDRSWKYASKNMGRMLTQYKSSLNKTIAIIKRRNTTIRKVIAALSKAMGRKQHEDKKLANHMINRNRQNTEAVAKMKEIIGDMKALDLVLFDLDVDTEEIVEVAHEAGLLRKQMTQLARNEQITLFDKRTSTSNQQQPQQQQNDTMEIDDGRLNFNEFRNTFFDELPDNEFEDDSLTPVPVQQEFMPKNVQFTPGHQGQQFAQVRAHYGQIACAK
jgi:hypothetical protein